MRVVIQRTGPRADVLRSWERRYRVVASDRSGEGQRLYSDEDVERLTLLRRAAMQLGSTLAGDARWVVSMQRPRAGLTMLAFDERTHH